MAEERNTIDINTADFETLSKLPMVGDKRAQFILDHRPFNSWEDMKAKVPGFSEGMISDLKNSNATLGK
ncbi:MAG: helix-hairpin-helix domain-containing protein [Fibrobacter sp.]|nr:helix-hairpin-helix domain-containing protein [Fibrobacter sp.]